MIQIKFRRYQDLSVDDINRAASACLHWAATTLEPPTKKNLGTYFSICHVIKRRTPDLNVWLHELEPALDLYNSLRKEYGDLFNFHEKVI